MMGYPGTGLFSGKHSILVGIYSPASGVKRMVQPENEDELSEEQRKKNSYSVIVVLIAVLFIGVSFIWHLWSALFPAPSP